MTYKAAKAKWNAASEKVRQGRGVKLDRNTYLVKLADRAYGIMLHQTIIVTITPTMYVLDSGGWHTMTTLQRMRDYVPFDIGSYSRKSPGWNIYLVSSDLDCYCMPFTGDPDNKIPGMERRWTGTWQLPNGDRVSELGNWAGTHDVRAVYEWVTCHYCQGNGKRTGPDLANAHPYFDGIRVSANGKRLMSKQPAKPKIWTPAVTRSGFNWRPSSKVRG